MGTQEMKIEPLLLLLQFVHRSQRLRDQDKEHQRTAKGDTRPKSNKVSD